MQVNDFDRQRLINFYGSALKKYGSRSPQAFHWISQTDQTLRFEILSEIGNLENCSILDVGCGVGDLYDFLRSRLGGFAYLGIDIVPEMIGQAKQKYPTADFLNEDIFNVAGEFDYLLASGSLTFNVGEGRSFYYQMIRHMYYLAKRGVGFNMLDAALYHSDQNYLVYNKQEVARFCESLADNYKIVTGYETGDFTVFLYKRNI